MHPADIKAALQKRGSSLSEIARSRRVTPTLVSHVIYSRSISRKTAQAIASATQLSLDTLWPGRYTKSLKDAS